MENLMRLDRFFSSQGLASRKEVRLLLKKGRITINGNHPKQPDIKINPNRDDICLDGKQIGFKEHLYLMLNKPAGVVSATQDPSQKTVLDLVPPALFRPGLFPAGRLDKDTTGLVILTDDGAFAHRILAPKSHVCKIYHAELDSPVDDIMIQKFQQGITLKDGSICLPAQIRPLQESNGHMAEMIIHEGKYHQIKRMAAACGRHVISLKRVQIGALKLDKNLPEGGCIEILHKDIEQFLTS